MITLITGTSSGLGLETAVLLAHHHQKVYATMRDTSKRDHLLVRAQTLGVHVEVLQLDVNDQKSVEKAVNHIIDKEGRIDFLINNAGAGFAKTTEHASEEEVEWVLNTNLKSVIRCTKAVLPFMRKQKSGHVINISSVGGLVGQPFNELYCAAKFGVEGYTEAMATYLTEPFGIKFTAVEPGGIATDFAKSATQKTMGTEGLPQDDYLPIIQKYISGMQKRAASGEARSYQTAEQVAEVILKVIQAENPPIRVRTSDWAEDFCHFKTQADPTGEKQNQKVIDMFLKG